MSVTIVYRMTAILLLSSSLVLSSACNSGSQSDASQSSEVKGAGIVIGGAAIAVGAVALRIYYLANTATRGKQLSGGCAEQHTQDQASWEPIRRFFAQKRYELCIEQRSSISPVDLAGEFLGMDLDTTVRQQAENIVRNAETRRQIFQDSGDGSSAGICLGNTRQCFNPDWSAEQQAECIERVAEADRC